MALRIENLLSPLTVDDFKRTVRSRQVRHWKGLEGRFRELLGWDQVMSMLSYSRALPPRIRLVCDGAAVADSEYVTSGPPATRAIDPQRVIRQLQHGATLVVNGIDELSSNAQMLAESCDGAMHVRTQLNAYVASGDTRGFKIHSDDHDVLILQTLGKKKWTVYEGRIGPSSGDMTASSAPRIAWQGELQAGEVLYIPRGWLHEALPCGMPTMHVTVSITYPTALSLTRWLFQELQDDAWCQLDMPELRDQAAHEGFCRSLCKKLTERLAQPRTVADFYLWHDAETIPRRGRGIPPDSSQLSTEDTIHLVAPYAKVVSRHDSSELGFSGQIIELGEQERIAAQWLIERSPATYAEYLAAMKKTGVTSAASILASLILAGFAYAERLSAVPME